MRGTIDIDYAIAAISEACQDVRLSEAQSRDVESQKLEKRRKERMAIYSLINKHISPEFMLGHKASGAPVLTDFEGNRVGIRISLSHSENYVAIAISLEGKSIGIDIEEKSPKLRRVAEKFVSDAEMAIVGTDDEALLKAWTIKEAVYKAAEIEGLSLTPGIRIVDREHGWEIEKYTVEVHHEDRCVMIWRVTVMEVGIEGDAMMALAEPDVEGERP